MRRRVAIVGSRPVNDAAEWARIVDDVRRFVDSLPSNVVIVSGGAAGVDTIAKDWRRPGQQMCEFPPDYKTHGKRATHVRNQQIVDDADEVHAWPSACSRGTWDTIRRAKAAGKPCVVHTTESKAAKVAKELHSAFMARGQFVLGQGSR